MAIWSLVSRATGFARVAVIAAALGALDLGDAYTTAQIFPGMIYELLLGGILASVLVPVLVQARKTEPDHGLAYTQRLLTLAVLALAAATALAVLCAPLLAASYAAGTPRAYQSLISSLSYLMLPSIFFYGLAGLFGAVLNIRGRFGAPVWAPILNNLVVIATGIVFLAVYGGHPIGRAEQVSSGQIALLGGGVLLGVAVQVTGLLPALRQVGFRWRWRFDFARLGLRRLARVGGWMFCYVAVNQLGLQVQTYLLNRAMRAGGGGPMIYYNVFLLVMMAHGIVAVSIITVLLPRMSAAAADGRPKDVAADLSRGIRMVCLVLAPVAVSYAVLAMPISVALFERGNFTRDASLQTASVLAAAGLALLPFAISQLFNVSYYSLQETKTPALINLPVMGVRLGVQVSWAVFAIATTAVGVMLGNAVSYLVAALLAAFLLRRRIGQIGLRRISVTLAKVSAAALAAAAAGYATTQLLPENAIWLTLVAGGTVIFGVYGAAAFMLRIGELKDVFAIVRSKFGK